MLNFIKSKIHGLKRRCLDALHRLKQWIKYRLDKTIYQQIKNPFTIPIIIISFNQLFYLQQLINFLLKFGFTNVVIIDNNSDYPPLLAYFDTLRNNQNVTIHQLKENHGHLVFWKEEALFEKYSKGYYVVTDADVVPFESTPKDFIKQFIKILNRNIHVTKVAFSLYLDDIPDTNPNKETIINWEKKFWENKVKNYFIADTDTTFALYRPNYKRNKIGFLSGIRTNLPYCARHGGWYLNPAELTAEQKHYSKTANNSSSWLTDENGELKNTFFKDHYTK